jgi:hypothetical protein
VPSQQPERNVLGVRAVFSVKGLLGTVNRDGSGRRTFFGSRRRSPEFGSPRSDSAQANPRRVGRPVWR